MEKYRVFAKKENRWWVVTVPALDVVGQARSVREIEPTAREIIALTLNIEDESSIDLDDIEFDLPDDTWLRWNSANEKDAKARELAAESARERSAAVKQLLRAGYSQSEAAAALEVSKQRISQLAV